VPATCDRVSLRIRPGPTLGVTTPPPPVPPPVPTPDPPPAPVVVLDVPETVVPLEPVVVTSPLAHPLEPPICPSQAAIARSDEASAVTRRNVSFR